MLIDWILTFQEIKRQIREKRTKDALRKTLVNTPLNYEIIQDLINTTRFDVKVNLTLKDGTKIEMVREDPYDRLQRTSRDPEQRY